MIKKTIFLLIASALLLACDTQDPLSNAFYFSDNWMISEVNAPDYPFDYNNETNPITFSFNKQGQYELHLKLQSCNGNYEADNEGSIRFTRNNCSANCCDSEWDYYLITLIKKANTYTREENSQIILYIDNHNYIILEAQNTITPINTDN